jgi:hypothetical protein
MATIAADLLARTRQFAMSAGVSQYRAFELRQRAQMRLAPEKPWLDVAAEQWLDAATLDFRWKAKTRIAGIMPLSVFDAFEKGRGELSLRLAGLIPLASAQGREVDRGEMMRALAELPWRPTGFASEAIAWSSPSANTLRASFEDGTIRCFVDLEVDAEGKVLAAGAPDRPRSVGKKFIPTAWRGTFADYKDFGGMHVPTRAEVSWLLPEGLFTYFRCKVDDFRAVRA